MEIQWTEYMKYRLNLRNFDMARVEDVLRFSIERYWDSMHHRRVVIGRCDKTLVLVPYDEEGKIFIPITIHATNRKQIQYRIKIGRFKDESSSNEIF